MLLAIFCAALKMCVTKKVEWRGTAYSHVMADSLGARPPAEGRLTLAPSCSFSSYRNSCEFWLSRNVPYVRSERPDAEWIAAARTRDNPCRLNVDRSS